MKQHPKFKALASPFADDAGPTPEETLRFLHAFHCIDDPVKQAKVIGLLELHASKSPRFASALRKLQTKH